MKNSTLQVGLLVVALLLPLTINAQCYELIWSDEFDETGLPDSTYWTFEEGGGGFGNNEIQYYTSNDLDNARIEDGRLIITAREESMGGRNYTSARMITRDKLSFRYGKIEARIRLPYTQGIWPAFWMLGDNISEVSWPACGEIDIMEFIGGAGNESTIHGTAHWDNNGSHAEYGGSYTLESGIFADDYHVFSIEWDETSIRWFIDDHQYHEIDITPGGLSEFHNEFFILLNVAVGGNWPGYPDDTSVFPQTMEVDYVRVYKKSEEVSELVITGDTVVHQLSTELSYFLPFSPDWTYDWSVTGDAEITNGSGTEKVTVDWGCTTDTITCQVTGTCGTYTFRKTVHTGQEIQGPLFVDENETGVTFTIDNIPGTEYSWSFPGDASIVSGQNNDTVVVDWGTTFEPVELELNNLCGSTMLSSRVVKTGQYPYPDILNPNTIPGTIQAVEFDYGGEGVGYHDNTIGNTGGGPRQNTDVDTENNSDGSTNVGWIDNGEWLAYSIQVETDTFYRVDMRVATDNSSGGPFSLHVNGEKRLDGITVSNTGGWRSFSKINAGTIHLTYGDTLLKVNFDAGGFNLADMTFTMTNKPVSSRFGKNDNSFTLYPVPASDFVYVSGKERIRSISVFGSDGRLIKHVSSPEPSTNSMNIQDLPSGIYVVRLLPAKGDPRFEKMIKQ